VPEGLAAIAAFDPSVPAAANAEEMQAFAAQVRTGEVTRAVRSAETGDGRPIEAGQWIGIERGNDVVEVGDSMLEVSRGLLETLLGPESGLVTVLAGEGAGPAHVAAVRGWLAVEHPGVAVEVHRTDRPHYPLTFGVE
jgi:uncharacterized protein